ncbi:copper ion binding protein [Natranaerobius trueperi]|uniref:Copper chaperone CopZ n=1 Tax=Natranaerobius trueperi TaxID=759412 RepID=A0A226C0P3_9FIRM|nr:copper ion binding protein [Natranaerobius trueperi]OWZ83947.1 copper resistance protein CopZ [Natranaerobius trueperi]
MSCCGNDKIVFNVKGMSCSHCKMAIENTLKSKEGIKNIEVDLDTGKVAISFDKSKITKEHLKAVITDTGYEVA